MLTKNADDQLQNAQPKSQIAQEISETSSGSAGQSTRRTASHPSISTAIPEVHERQSRHNSTAPEIFAISEDSFDDTHPSQATTTDDSILSIRDPNSQSTKQNHPFSPKEDFPYLEKSIENSERTDSLPILANQVQLPDTLDSREPPKPPSSFEDDMSDIAPNDSGLPEGMQPLRIRATLKRIREEGEAKRAAARSGKRLHSEPSASRKSPSLAREDREGSQKITAVGPSSLVMNQPEQSQLPSTEETSAPYRYEQPRPLPSGDRSLPSVMREDLHLRAQSPITVKPLRSTASPSVIPAKAPYQVQEEPERLEIQPSTILKEISLPAHNSPSAPHTPTTPSKLSMHKEASPVQSQTTTLTVKNLGPGEYIVTLPMQPRILSQYVDTVEYYPQAIGKNMTAETIGEDVVEKLNTLLCRLGNVATHIGLEGGGPTSQEVVKPEEEALYAELSSEKFRFLGHLLALTRESQIHIAVVAKPGDLFDIIEVFLKGKSVPYLRQDQKRSGGGSYGLQTVSIIASGGAISLPPVHLIIAFDESFNANDAHIAKMRQPNASGNELIPVVRLVVYSSVEHLDLCLARSLEPVDRIRKLIFCVWHTQRSVGQLEPHEPSTIECAQEVFEFFKGGFKTSAWTLPNIRPIENLPIMDSDSSLSDAISDISNICKPEGPPKYYPNTVGPRVTDPNNPGALPRGRRPFVSPASHETICPTRFANNLQDIEYGDSLQVQAKKRKMLADHNAGRLNNPVSSSTTIRFLCH